MAKKPRRWSNTNLPAPVEEMNPRLLLVFAEKDKRAAATPAELAAEWTILEAEEALANKADYDRNVKFDALEKRLLEELAKIKELTGHDSFQHETLGTFHPGYTLFPTVVDEAALRQWLTETGQEALLETKLPGGTLKSLVVDALDPKIAAMLSPAQRAELKPGDAGSNMPPPGVKVYVKPCVKHPGGGGAPTRTEDE